MNNLKVSIIISVDNNFELVDNFFSHILNLELKEDRFEYIVVIDACRDIQTIKYLKSLNKKLKNFHLKILENRVGYAVANNIGVYESNFDYLLFINTDVFPKKKAIVKLLKYLISNSNVGCVQGLLLYPQTNKVQSTGHIFSKYLNRHALKNRDEKDTLVQLTQERQALTSAFYMIPKHLYNSIGGMDEFFFNAYDGMELSLRISKSGYKCMYYPNAIAFHATGASRSFMSVNEEQQSAYFWVKWYSKITIDLDNLLALQINNNLLTKKYFVVDISNANYLWKETLNNLNIIFDTIHTVDIKLKQNFNFFISLAKTLHQSNMPLLFVCDDFTYIINNKEWFKTRKNKSDIIFDLHGNVVLPHSRIQ